MDMNNNVVIAGGRGVEGDQMITEKKRLYKKTYVMLNHKG